MSQHYFSTTAVGVSATILAGWDRPLQGYFMVVMDDDGEPLFSNLELPESHPKDFRAFQPHLDRVGIVLPDEMIAEILADGARNMGNKIVNHEIVKGKYSRRQRL